VNVSFQDAGHVSDFGLDIDEREKYLAITTRASKVFINKENMMRNED